MLGRVRQWLLGAGLLALAGGAQAQLDDFEALDNPAEAEKPFEGQAELGYHKISGNSHSGACGAGADMTWFDAPGPIT